MPLVTISAEAEAAIRSRATNDFHQTGHRNPDGTFTVPLDEETVARLKANAHPGETLSDTIIRACAVLGKSVQ